MSALPPKEDISAMRWFVRYGPNADMSADGAVAQPAKTSIAVAAKMSNAMLTNATIAEARPMISQ